MLLIVDCNINLYNYKHIDVVEKFEDIQLDILPEIKPLNIFLDIDFSFGPENCDITDILHIYYKLKDVSDISYEFIGRPYTFSKKYYIYKLIENKFYKYY